jgi:hypothetical protein
LSSIFLFGAGASYGSGPCAPQAPPLGWQMFDALVDDGGIAATVEPALAKLFREDFENGMDIFIEQRSTDLSAFLRDMARFFARFSPLPGNCYIELLRLLGDRCEHDVFVSTNYETLLEESAAQLAMCVAYAGTRKPRRCIRILKIHGSCNILPQGRQMFAPDSRIDISDASDAVIYEGPVTIADTAEQVLEYCANEGVFAPAVAAYSPKKHVYYCRRYIMRQQEAWQEALRGAKKVFIVGLRVHPIDTHIWEPLAKAAATLYYIDPKCDLWDEWIYDVGRRNAHYLAGDFTAALPQIARILRRKYTLP